ncbi:MAG: GGDEF domain-containing protein [Rhodoferax sp.]|nr:GGDEF domain-containing protein [Rhodoferax sp.]
MTRPRQPVGPVVQWLTAWVELGVSAEGTDANRRRQYLIHASPWIVLTAVLLYMGIFVLIGSPTLVWTTVYQLPVVFMGALWIRVRQHQHKPAPYLVTCVICQAAVFTGIFTGQGTLFNTHFYLLAFALTTPLVIPIQGSKGIATVCIQCMVSYVVLEYFQWPAAPEVQTLPPQIIKMLAIFITFSACAMLFVSFYISESFSNELEERLRHMATTDTLTLLANRRTFQQALVSGLHRAQRNQAPLCLAILDVDWFKRVNDTYGHDVGDEVLKHVAQWVQKEARRGDLVARFGGEELVILMHDCTLTDARNACERIRTRLENTPCLTESARVVVTASFGLALWEPAMPERRLLEAADRALYQAKARGRNRIEIANSIAPTGPLAYTP